jgi:hypothetical protein
MKKVIFSISIIMFIVSIVIGLKGFIDPIYWSASAAMWVGAAACFMVANKIKEI